MKVLDDVALISAPGWRARAYAQRMVADGVAPSLVVHLPGDEPRWDGPAVVETDVRQDGAVFPFRPGVPARETWDEIGVPALDSPVADVNAEAFVAGLDDIAADVLIYLGFQGTLLRPPVLDRGKRFLHVHGGYAPAYRGSTAFYYSLLREGTIGATAIWLEPGIDTGPILGRRRYPAPKGVEIDRIMDPVARADLLCEVLAERVRTGRFPPARHDHEGAETYHVIHPVLKHLALRRCGLTEGGADR